MQACLTKINSSQVEGCRSDGSSYPEFETAYFKRVYGSDHLLQLHDDHQEEALYRYVLPTRKAELKKILNRNSHLVCENDPVMTKPGRSAYSLAQLVQNLEQYEVPKARSLRWNKHYQQALSSVAEEVRHLLKPGTFLKPMSIGDVAASGPVIKNLDKNAGYYVFETGKRSKGENLDDAVEWCTQNMTTIMDNGFYDIPYVISHRSSNSKPTSKGKWKWKCRVILMQDIRALLLDGRFAVPFTDLFKGIPWGEGSMTQEQVRHWIMIKRDHYDAFYSSDYSKFDVSQPDWLLEDIMHYVVKPLFGSMTSDDERLFEAMVYSYIHKDIHSFDRVYHADGCQVSGAITTYAYNTIGNQIIDRTVLLMMGCDYRLMPTLKCGDDNLTFYNKKEQPWNRRKHCELISKYFGIKTTLGEEDCGDTDVCNPVFLSREWTRSGEKRPIQEVLWNLVYPERYRDYTYEKTGVTMERAVALVLYSSCLEQDVTMREWFDIDRICQAAKVRRGDFMSTYKALASLGTGFRTPWLNFKFGNLKQ